MAYSYTDKKRVRKDFGKRPEILAVPFMLEMQLASYRRFLQADKAADNREDGGLHAAFGSIFQSLVTLAMLNWNMSATA